MQPLAHASGLRPCQPQAGAWLKWNYPQSSNECSLRDQDKPEARPTSNPEPLITLRIRAALLRMPLACASRAQERVI